MLKSIRTTIQHCSNSRKRNWWTVFLRQKYSSIHDLTSHLDRVVHYADSHHIAVYHKGRWYKIFMFYRNNLLEPCELQVYGNR